MHFMNVQKFFVVASMLLLLGFFGACSDDDTAGDGGSASSSDGKPEVYVSFDLSIEKMGISNLPVQFTTGHSGQEVITNISAGVTNVYTNVYPGKAYATVWTNIIPYNDGSALTFVTATPSDVAAGEIWHDDAFTLSVPLQETGQTNINSMFTWISLSNFVFEETGNADLPEYWPGISGSMTVTEFGEVGNYVQGTFHLVLTNKSTNMVVTNGIFKVYRMTNVFRPAAT